MLPATGARAAALGRKNHARHRATRLRERRGNGRARLHGRRRRGSAHAGCGAGARRSTADADGRAGGDANFYRAALGAIDRASQALNNGRPFVELGEAEQRSFVDNMRQNKVEGWQGPAGPFVYLVLRSDAVDVVYGTMDGYAALGIPYMPHIAPSKRW
jgi:hypothetical protein